ncbi:MAG: 3-phosphoglycerate dehydrogenase family protein [Longibaculum muris]|uniref:D-3-phosphoglycerate dehydrogenase n=1 Tax=Longibaculum muris TaxID=1796628 RepID=A0A4R3Z3N5_9FIRM|nr:3-phosphoglycerate dehydrogenase family protein [Longibaculum muris]KXU42539.1 4-phosphoerythronate dehydrogenase [Candidatus Stoquefichus sp. KLE1796]MBS5368502.1 3-phosphoglycerate dehydrogenase [Coprobacillus cateniformis]MCR1887940.1 3-phosphoglycerate dehydrogenase family protein [Longibaculum muris]MED9812895.1 3-phosphoglycerate dehydrogenase family protein [Longibaculum muris]TCV98534.1 D-3-phosphoglycerate dehydrogenase [Longibaculum muris]
MNKIKLMNKISPVGLDLFGEQYQVGEDIDDEDGILVRSASLHDYTFNKNLKAIARAGAGVNNIPIDQCSNEGIVVFNTPGANANAVKELVLCGLLLSSRKIVEGIDWVKTLEGKDDASKLVEKGKSQFVGPELEGKKLGIIGLGAIGVHVANAAIKLGMEVYGFDPYISVNAAWGMSKWVKNAQNMETIFSECDYITLHAPSTKETKGLINKESIDMMKDGVRILNFARGDLVNSTDVLAAVKEGKIAKYVTDFASPDIINQENVIVMPHLGASTPESEDNCARMAVKEIKDYLESGNIVNSVNFPYINEPRTTKYRICLIHKNIPNMLAQFATLLANREINIENMVNKAKGEYAYTIIETNDVVDMNDFEALENVIKVRVIE